MKPRLQIVATTMISALLTWAIAGALEKPPMPIVRIAELQIDPAQLAAYTTAVKEEMEDSVRVEPGVLAIYAVAEKNDPTRLRFFEMYADENGIPGAHTVAALQEVLRDNKDDDHIAKAHRNCSRSTECEAQ